MSLAVFLKNASLACTRATTKGDSDVARPKGAACSVAAERGRGVATREVRAAGAGMESFRTVPSVALFFRTLGVLAGCHDSLSRPEVAKAAF